jgi:hypothetical protein
MTGLHFCGHRRPGAGYTLPVCSSQEPDVLGPPQPAHEVTSSIGAGSREARLPFLAKLTYAMDGTTDIFGHWLYNVLANPVFVTFRGLSPTAVSSALAAARMADAFADPLFGWMSDNARTRSPEFPWWPWSWRWPWRKGFH